MCRASETQEPTGGGVAVAQQVCTGLAGFVLLTRLRNTHILLDVAAMLLLFFHRF